MYSVIESYSNKLLGLSALHESALVAAEGIVLQNLPPMQRFEIWKGKREIRRSCSFVLTLPHGLIIPWYYEDSLGNDI